MKFTDLTNKEIVIFSIVLGTLVALALGYILGEVQYFTPKGYRIKEPNNHTNEVFKVNYLMLFSGFIISSGICYLYLTMIKTRK